MSTPSQDKRMIQVSDLVGKDVLIATSIHGEEHISKPYRYQLQLTSSDHDITQDKIVGNNLTASIHYAGNLRHINGYVTNFSLHDVNAEGRRSYTATIRPGLWFTSLGGKNRIFEKKSVDAILKEVLGEYSSVIKTSFKLGTKYIDREYCVQFNETDFQFIHRLMAEEGIAYYFKHADGAHEMVICDSASDFYDCAKEPFEYDGGGSLPTKNSVSSWHRDFNYHGGGIELRDYNEYTAAKDNEQRVKTTSALNGVSGYIQSRYGLNHFEADGASKHKFSDSYHRTLAERAIQAQECRFDIGHGSGDCTEFSAGSWFEFDHPLKSEKGKYLITSVCLAATDSNSEDSSFKNTFSCIPDKVMPRPDPFDSTNCIQTPQVAKVISVKATESDGSEDQYTQVKVQFPWNSAQNSCWIRVVQAYSGKGWGASFVPRVGQEVVVNYINGDPDRPLVTGAVYNGDNTGPKFTATQSGWKTQIDNSKFNELRFDDKSGKEEIYMEAGKDHNFVVHNDQSGKIENNQTLEVKQNRSITITDGNENVTLSKGNQSITLDSGNHTLKVSKGKQTTDVTGAISITSKSGIELKVAGNSIKISPSGITIKGTMLSCQGDAKAEVKGGGMLTLKGGVTMIN